MCFYCIVVCTTVSFVASSVRIQTFGTIICTIVQYILEKIIIVLFVLFCFVALRPKSTAKVIAGRSVHLTALFPRQA